LWVRVAEETHQQLLMVRCLFNCLDIGSVCDFLMLVVLVAVNTNKAMKSRSPQFQLCKAKKKNNWQNHQGKKTKTQKIVCVVCAIFSAFCNVNLCCGDGTSLIHHV